MVEGPAERPKALPSGTLDPVPKAAVDVGGTLDPTVAACDVGVRRLSSEEDEESSEAATG